MRSATLGFVAGAALMQQQADVPSALLLSAILIFAAGFMWLSRSRGKLQWRAAGQLICGIGAGFAWAGLFALAHLRHELPPEWEGRDITLIGTIDSLPSRFERGVRFNFAVEEIVGEEVPASFPPRLALSWYSTFHRDELQRVADPQPGERWQLTVRLRRPHGNANPHGFDYEVWLLEQNLRATGTVRPDQRLSLKNTRLDPFVPGFNSIVQRSRAWLREKIHAALPEHEYAGVIVALVVGDQRAIDQSDWKVFNRTGVSHLVSISGLHITMISALFASLALALWRRSFFTSAQLPLLLPAQKAAALAGAASALLYVLLAGFGVPAQRTLAMLSVVALALWLGRITSVSHVLCAALGFVVLLDPWAVLQPGFWLSFGAVAAILYTSVGRALILTQTQAQADAQVRAQRHGDLSLRQRWMAGLHSAARTQYAVTLGLVPLTMLLFSQVSLASPIANAIAIPLVSFLVTPLALIGSILPMPLAEWVLGTAHWLVVGLARILHWLSALPVAVWSAPVPGWLMFAAAAIGVVWLLAPRGWPLRWLGVVAVVPMLANSASAPEDGQMWVTAFDVGQGTALLVETPNRRLLYDTGPAYSPESDGGNRVILPYFKGRGIYQLDAIIVSHSDVDHAGGALSIMEEIKVGWVSSSLPPDHAIVQRAAEHRRCESGQSWEWDGVRFEMLYPASVSYSSSKWKPNARSCTLKISVGPHSILLPGDIEAVQEDHLVSGDAERLRSSILVAPHHGSGTSSTQPFLEAVQPETALFQVGYRNRYQHPKAEVFERYASLGIKRIRTDDSGAVTMRFGERIDIVEYRTERARYWHGR